ncbi:30S ribosomal protein S18 [Candidatus Daviesbacteria bacterium]|nr:30S ribosomal protein S18 [Candidatus Daviesbacteria bacterium]
MAEETGKEDDKKTTPARRGRVCFFCEAKKDPDFTDSASLRKFMSDRARIMPKAKTGICSKHQRVVTRQIKYARHLSLLPFINRA